MSGLVLELQQKALVEGGSVVELLQFALVVARKLKQTSIVEFINWELEGYEDYEKIPNYRSLQGQVKILSHYRGWELLPFESDEERIKYSKQKLMNTIATIEQYSSAEQSYRLHIDRDFMLPALRRGHPGTHITSCKLELQPISLVSIISIVKKKILDWALELEDKGILGEGMTFTSEEKEKAQNITNYYGAIHNSQLQTNPVNSSQTYTNNQTDWEAFRSLLPEIRTELANLQLDPKAQKVAETNLKTAEMQLELEEPDASMIQTALNTFLTITHGTAGSAAFEGLKALVAGL